MSNNFILIFFIIIILLWLNITVCILLVEVIIPKTIKIGQWTKIRFNYILKNYFKIRNEKFWKIIYYKLDKVLNIMLFSKYNIGRFIGALVLSIFFLINLYIIYCIKSNIIGLIIYFLYLFFLFCFIQANRFSMIYYELYLMVYVLPLSLIITYRVIIIFGERILS